MSDIDKETLKDKKKKLEAELNNIQNELDHEIDNVKSDVANSLDPIDYIRRHPLPVVGASVLIGFLIGKSGDDDHQRTKDSESKREKITSTLGYEAKRLATRKALTLLSDFMDDFLSRD